MQVNNPINDVSKEIISDTKNSINIKKSESESDECATGCGLCCICYLICLPLFSSLQ
jgi:hypothetical protein